MRGSPPRVPESVVQIAAVLQRLLPPDHPGHHPSHHGREGLAGECVAVAGLHQLVAVVDAFRTLVQNPVLAVPELAARPSSRTPRPPPSHTGRACGVRATRLEVCAGRREARGTGNEERDDGGRDAVCQDDRDADQDGREVVRQDVHDGHQGGPRFAPPGRSRRRPGRPRPGRPRCGPPGRSGQSTITPFLNLYRKHPGSYEAVSITTVACSERRCTPFGGVLPSPGYVNTYKLPFFSGFTFALNSVRQVKSSGRLTTA